MSSIKEITITDAAGQKESRTFRVNSAEIIYNGDSVEIVLKDYDDRLKVLENFKETFSDVKLDANNSNGTGSISYNTDSTLTGINAISLGNKNNISSSAGIGLGQENTVSGDYAAAIGSNNTVSGATSFAEGNGNIIETAASAHAEGNNNFVSNNGSYAHVGGNQSEAGGEASFAHGNKAKAAKNYSIALGNNVETTHDNEVVIGTFNSKTFELEKIPSFVIGAGATEGDRKNAFVVYRDGTVTLDKIIFSDGTYMDTADASLIELHELEQRVEHLESLFSSVEGVKF